MSDKIVIVKNPLSTLPAALTVIEDPTVPSHKLIIRTENHEVVIDAKAGTLHKRRRLKFEPVPAYGTHMTWLEFMNHAQCLTLDDANGVGMLATATEMSNVSVSSERTQHEYPDEDGPQPYEWATHVVWLDKQ